MIQLFKGFALILLLMQSSWADIYILYDKSNSHSQSIVEGIQAGVNQCSCPCMRSKTHFVTNEHDLIGLLHKPEHHLLLGIDKKGEFFLNKYSDQLKSWRTYFMPIDQLNLTQKAWQNLRGLFVCNYYHLHGQIKGALEGHSAYKNKVLWLSSFPSNLDRKKLTGAGQCYQKHFPQDHACIIVINDKFGRIGNLNLHQSTGELEQFARTINMQFADMPIVIIDEQNLAPSGKSSAKQVVDTKTYINPVTLAFLKHLKALRRDNKNSIYHVRRVDCADPKLALYNHLEKFPDSVLLIPDDMTHLMYDIYRLGYTKSKKIHLYSATDKSGTTSEIVKQAIEAQGYNKYNWKQNKIEMGQGLPADHTQADPNEELVSELRKNKI